MVVQTLRMKIQESPVACDPAGRIGGGEVRVSEPDCEDVPRLDLTALTEDSGNWGGEDARLHHAASFNTPIIYLTHMKALFTLCMQDKQILEICKQHADLHTPFSSLLQEVIFLLDYARRRNVFVVFISEIIHQSLFSSGLIGLNRCKYPDVNTW